MSRSFSRRSVLIACQMPPGSPVGATYQFLDEMVEPGVTYYYWLEDVDTHGQATRHGPVSGQVLRGRPYRIYLPQVSEYMTVFEDRVLR